MEGKNSTHHIPGGVKNSIIQYKKQILEAFNNGDINGVAMSYAKDAMFFPPNSNALKGLDKIEVFWKSFLDRGIKKIELETINIATSGSTAFETGNYLLFLENGQLADFGDYVAIWRKKVGEWKLYLHLWNSDISADIDIDQNIHINEALKNDCELIDIGCSYINFNSVKCEKCAC